MTVKLSFARACLIALFLYLSYFTPSLDAQSQCATSGDADFTLSAASGSPVPTTHSRTFTFSNDSDLLVRVVDINPFAFKCSVATSSQAYQETAISSFLGIIGGVANVGASTPNAAAPTAPAPPKTAPGGTPSSRSFTAHGTAHTAPPNACVDAYLYGVHNEVSSLQDDRDSINGAFQTTLNNEQTALQSFENSVSNLRAQNSCANTVTAAQALANSGPFAIATVSGLDLGNAIDQLALQGQSLLSRLTTGTDACKADLASIIDEDSAFLTALVHGSTSLPSAVDRWRTQLSQLNNVNAQLASAKVSIGAVLQNRQNFSIDTSIHGHQEAVKVTVTCTPVAIAQVPGSANASIPAPVPPSANPPTTGTANTWNRTFSFGAGPRFVLAGGIVVSPLAQITFSTSANPAASGSGTTVPANIVVNQQKSSTRILPIGMLHGRLWDQLPPKSWMSYFPNYLSFGVTAKSSDNKGTNIEYLFGPSWAFAERQLFLTAGAYAGQQQRLGGSLSVGQATSLSAANLPISQTTIWKAGFAITWAPGGK